MGHFYTTEGICIDGLRAARKFSPLPLPSPTTVLSMIKGEGLIQYFKRQMWEAAVTTPRQPHWDDDAHYEACVRWAEEHGKAARDKGGEFHDQVQLFHTGKPMPLGDQNPMLDAYAQWYDRYVDCTIGTELVVIGEGYGGRLDHLCLLKDGRIAITDTKSQDISKRRTFNHYPEWALQLGAYAGAVNRFPGPDTGTVDTLVSICISSKPPFVVEAYYWPKPIDYYANLFMGMLALWKEVNDYWP
jgi:hypothetical protein